jgi:hypothetical protein
MSYSGEFARGKNIEEIYSTPPACWGCGGYNDNYYNDIVTRNYKCKSCIKKENNAPSSLCQCINGCPYCSTKKKFTSILKKLFK